jgi:hypothetical protein
LRPFGYRSCRGVSIVATSTGYIDLEFGQIYGSYRRDFVPTEVGLLINRSDDDNVIVRGKKFEFDQTVVMRKNSIDSLGNPIGLEEYLYNPSNSRTGEYDPRFRIERESRAKIEKDVRVVFGQLRDFVSDMIGSHDIDHLVFYGSQEDMNLLKRAGSSVSSWKVSDLQKIIGTEVGLDLSLDKISMIIDYRNDGRKISSRHHDYFIPERFQHLLKPHKAVGDVARIFLASKEFTNHRMDMVRSIKDHIKKIQRYRNLEEEVPIF